MNRGGPEAGHPNSPLELFRIFLRLGCIAFGGPVAHLGFFREEFVRRRGWFDERTYADIVALCQFMPGPASSQTGLAIGLARGGYGGMAAAWAGFTLPSAVIMLLLAVGLSALGDITDAGWLRGLKLVALAVVANALLGMARALCTDRPRVTIAFVSAAFLLAVGTIWGQVLVILAGAVAGLAAVRVESDGDAPPLALRVPIWIALSALVLFAALLVLLPLIAGDRGFLALFDTFYRAGALVFGGGHVVLPWLESGTVDRGWVDRDTFLAGYGAAQALPGPLFTFSAFLGTAARDDVLGGIVALIAIFASSFLLVPGLLPFWDRLRGMGIARQALAGVNAAVVGLLGAALYDPVFTASVDAPVHLAFALVAFLLLAHWKVPPWMVVLGGAAAGWLLQLSGQVTL